MKSTGEGGAGGRWRLSAALGLLTLVSVGGLLLWDAAPTLFPARAHDILSALPLAMIAVACLVHRLESRPTRAELLRTSLLAAAFLFWSANQFWPDSSNAVLLNDLAVALFVLDVVLAIADRPSSTPPETTDLGPI